MVAIEPMVPAEYSTVYRATLASSLRHLLDAAGLTDLWDVAGPTPRARWHYVAGGRALDRNGRVMLLAAWSFWTRPTAPLDLDLSALDPTMRAELTSLAAAVAAGLEGLALWLKSREREIA